jgi:hypothetical protein
LNLGRKALRDDYFERKEVSMNHLDKKDSTLLLKIDTFDLNPAQIRLLKHINTLLVHVIAADEEAEYFEISAELIKQTAALIQNTNFTKDQRVTQQALEFALDFLQDRLDENSTVNLDN